MSRINLPVFIVWLTALLAIFISSLYPLDSLPAGAGLLGDKVMHCLAYMVVGFLAIFATRIPTIGLIFIVLSLLVGVLIEFLQPLTGRHFEVADMGANLAGLLLALVVWKIIFGRKLLK